MTMNNGPASVACLVGVVPKRTQLKQKIPFGNCRESWSLARRDMLWSYCVCLSYGCVAVSERLPIIILQKVMQADGNNGYCGDRCIEKVRSYLSGVGKEGQKSQEVSDTMCEFVRR